MARTALDWIIASKRPDNYRAISGIRDEIEEAMASWMSSPGHSRNILNPQHKMVNIGLAWDRYNTAMYQRTSKGTMFHTISCRKSTTAS